MTALLKQQVASKAFLVSTLQAQLRNLAAIRGFQAEVEALKAETCALQRAEADEWLVTYRLRLKVEHLEVRNEQLMAAKGNTFPKTKELACAPCKLQSKDDVLDAMHLIAIPLAAAFLGITSAELRNLRVTSSNEFGELNRGAWCYSLNELLIFAKNPKWFGPNRRAAGRMFNISEARGFLYFGTVVDAEIACAYLNVNTLQIERRVCHQGGPTRRRGYRLSEVRAAFSSLHSLVLT